MRRSINIGHTCANKFCIWLFLAL